MIPASASVRLERRICPVVVPPIVKFWALVVPRFPIPVRNVVFAPLLAEMEAVGVPELTLIKANLDDWVEVPPSNRSCVLFTSVINPPFVPVIA